MYKLVKWEVQFKKLIVILGNWELIEEESSVQSCHKERVSLSLFLTLPCGAAAEILKTHCQAFPQNAADFEESKQMGGTLCEQFIVNTLF